MGSREIVLGSYSRQDHKAGPKGRTLAKGQRLTGLSPDGKQLARDTTQTLFPPRPGEFRDEKAREELATDGRETSRNLE